MSDVDNKVKMIVEGVLLAAGRPLSLDSIAKVFSVEERPDGKELKAVLQSISDDCNDKGFELKEVASGYRFQVKQDLSEWVAKLWEERPPRYTRALLETLSLIAYRQPITRGDIEEIRGVAVSANIIRTLLDREWIRVVGHRDVPGRPAMFATTKQFLDYFNLKSLQGLPPLAEVKALDKSDEFNLNDDLENQRVLDLPEEVVDEGSVEKSEAEIANLLAEEEAIELSKKPLDEILSLDPARLREHAETDLEDGADSEDGEEAALTEDSIAEEVEIADGEAGSESEGDDESIEEANSQAEHELSVDMPSSGDSDFEIEYENEDEASNDASDESDEDALPEESVNFQEQDLEDEASNNEDSGNLEFIIEDSEPTESDFEESKE